jgi:hypothetical protein
VKEIKTYSQSTLESEVKTKTLAILVASVLLASSFTFSSCKNCNGNNGKNNPVTYRDPSKDNSDLTEVGGYLKNKGASDTEIRAMTNIEKEDFDEEIGCVMWHNGHFWYRDRKRDHDGLQTPNNCGLYAIKRLLFVLGKHGRVAENLWYKHTDQDLRDKLAKMLKGEKYKYQDNTIHGFYIRTLMRDIGVPIEYCRVCDINSIMDPWGSIFVPSLLGVADELMAKIGETRSKAIDAWGLRDLAQQQVKKAQAEMENVNNTTTLPAEARNAAAVEVIKASDAVKQVVADAQAVVKEAKLGGLEATFTNNLLLKWYEFSPELNKQWEEDLGAIVTLVSYVAQAAKVTEELAAKARQRLN